MVPREVEIVIPLVGSAADVVELTGVCVWRLMPASIALARRCMMNLYGYIWPVV